MQPDQAQWVVRRHLARAAYGIRRLIPNLAPEVQEEARGDLAAIERTIRILDRLAGSETALRGLNQLNESEN